jgi:hypothetical protein
LWLTLASPPRLPWRPQPRPHPGPVGRPRRPPLDPMPPAMAAAMLVVVVGNGRKWVQVAY